MVGTNHPGEHHRLGHGHAYCRLPLPAATQAGEPISTHRDRFEPIQRHGLWHTPAPSNSPVRTLTCWRACRPAVDPDFRLGDLHCHAGHSPASQTITASDILSGGQPSPAAAPPSWCCRPLPQILAINFPSPVIGGQLCDLYGAGPGHVQQRGLRLQRDYPVQLQRPAGQFARFNASITGGIGTYVASLKTARHAIPSMPRSGSTERY